MKTKMFTKKNLFGKVLLITCIAVLLTDIRVTAQATKATNDFSAAQFRFIGWGSMSSSDLFFITSQLAPLQIISPGQRK